MSFIGRTADLARLADQFDEVTRTGSGRFVLVRGRRRIGKSRLVEEFLRREQVPALYFTASRQSRAAELAAFARALARSGIAGADLVGGAARPESWEAALETVAGLARQAGPVVVVVDEFPYLADGDERLALEGTFQKVWDRVLQKLPVLLVLIGSDLAMMRALTDYERPLYGRPTKILDVKPFSPVEVAELIGLRGRAALEAYAIVGGSPLVAASWRKGETAARFLTRSLADETSPLVVDGERVLNAEFPATTQARQVLTAIGSGETTFTAVGRSAGIPQATLARALDVLVEQKHVVAADVPLSARAHRDRRYRIADPYLRFWLQFVGPALPDIERDRGALVARWTLQRLPDYRGQAIEPIVRESIERLLPDDRLGSAKYVGRFWTRVGDSEVDLVLADRPTGPADLVAVGSIKWRDRKRFDSSDAQRLARQAASVPGVTQRTLSIGVSPTGFARDAGLDLELGPDDLLAAWASQPA
jgi:uncharacterized protein